MDLMQSIAALIWALVIARALVLAVRTGGADPVPMARTHPGLMHR
ncbi:hypothetical protein NPS01_21230 [Nocardioides psychrotolerans]|uniref:Uncharacterized protein n=1 Tax=Nocardioides psychrotolerans TaxID=1005945 RepID=A0A1I3KFN4_9ACTN|nr:hypothetical protein [Nocardioides psychrotolerans]GEP38460.1 hypothetical protein NPS01_21230 [Nocardioides psychrotolerans]SFI71331.1 hypothetical protein SAMN05216561_11228 [Nocardioides psychrotolerans]